ncbi:hypothetical protein JARBOU2352_17090 [Enterococcus faecium]
MFYITQVLRRDYDNFRREIYIIFRQEMYKKRVYLNHKYIQDTESHAQCLICLAEKTYYIIHYSEILIG